MRTPSQRMVLGIDGGATRTVMLLATPDLKQVRRVEAGPGNLRLLSDSALVRLLRAARTPGRQLASIAIGLAGARSTVDRQRILRAAGTLWPGVPCYATHDLETALAAAPLPRQRNDDAAGTRRTPARGPGARAVQILVLSGTGSCCYGQSPSSRTARVGGWGHILGDRGSAYAIGRQALQEVLALNDRNGSCPHLGSRLLRKAGLNRLEECIDWIRHADKAAVAALAIEVFEAARSGDRIARRILRSAADQLCDDAVACARRLGSRPSATTFVLAGGTLLRQPAFATAVSRGLRAQRPNCRVLKLRSEGAWGAVRLALQHVGLANEANKTPPVALAVNPPEPKAPVPLSWLAHSPTESQNPRSSNLDGMPIRQAIELFLSEETRIAYALRRELTSIERASRTINRSLQSGGRLFYVGAGTSGRLGVLDASECPPTFGTSPDLVQGIIAGGHRALWEAVEGAEDDALAGAQALLDRRVTHRDAVVGIAASGRTPFVWGALTQARELKAATVLVSFNPCLKRLRGARPNVIIAPDVGPELLTGSTRLKAGSATKLLLNIFSTLAMVSLGKVLGNLMVDLNPSNVKLRDRAVRLVQAATGADHDQARAALVRARWNVRAVIGRCRKEDRKRRSSRS